MLKIIDKQMTLMIFIYSVLTQKIPSAASNHSQKGPPLSGLCFSVINAYKIRQRLIVFKGPPQTLLSMHSL